MVKLILTDIDDTIKPMDSPAVPQEAIDAFRAAMRAGIVVGPATARGYAWTRKYFVGAEDCCSTILATNGSEVYLEGERIFAARLAVEDLEEVRSYVAGVPRLPGSAQGTKKGPDAMPGPIRFFYFPRSVSLIIRSLSRYLSIASSRSRSRFACACFRYIALFTNTSKIRIAGNTTNHAIKFNVNRSIL